MQYSTCAVTVAVLTRAALNQEQHGFWTPEHATRSRFRAQYKSEDFLSKTPHLAGADSWAEWWWCYARFRLCTLEDRSSQLLDAPYLVDAHSLGGVAVL